MIHIVSQAFKAERTLFRDRGDGGDTLLKGITLSKGDTFEG